MIRIFDIAMKDLTQILRDKKTFLFLLIMPVVFTFLFGFAFGGFKKEEPSPRLPVTVILEDPGDLGPRLINLLEQSEVIAISMDGDKTLQECETLLQDGDLAGILIIPADYSQMSVPGLIPQLTLVTDISQSAGQAIQGEVLRLAARLVDAELIAGMLAQMPADQAALAEQYLLAWERSPILLENTSALASASQELTNQAQTLAHTSPGMIIQFAIAGLLTCATVLVNERKTRSLQRLLTTPARRVHILLGHYLAIFLLLFAQFLLFILFGQVVLGVDYLRLPFATLLVALATCLCIAAMGLLIGVLAKNEEQAIAFSLIPMFVFSGLGGAWTPLEFTSPAFQAIGHVTPVAWAMDGFKNITVRLLEFDSILLPAAALGGYALFFFLLAVWRFHRISE